MSVVSEIAIVPESECSTPTFTGQSCANAGAGLAPDASQELRTAIRGLSRARTAELIRTRRGMHRRSEGKAGPDDLDEGKASARAAAEHQGDAVAILYRSGVNDRAQHQTERVDEEMALDVLGLLACVIPGRRARRLPFSADLTLSPTDLDRWRPMAYLSMIAALGPASRPSAARSARRRVSWMRASVPS